jgi:hypothetical protein
LGENININFAARWCNPIGQKLSKGMKRFCLNTRVGVQIPLIKGNRVVAFIIIIEDLVEIESNDVIVIVRGRAVVICDCNFIRFEVTGFVEPVASTRRSIGVMISGSPAA